MASQTSRDAFHSQTPSELGDAQARVLRLLQAHPEGLTGSQIDRELGGSHTDHRRARDLVVAGLAREAGTRRDLVTGKQGIVFVAGGAGTTAPRTPRVISLSATLGGSATQGGTDHVYVLDEAAQAEWCAAEELAAEVSTSTTVITDALTDYLDW
jgi:hypothetical protein